MFTERDAILFEMEELKEQARRDFEIYIESRRHRNERYDQLQNRLREIDREERQPTSQPPVETLDKIIERVQPETMKPETKEEPYVIPQWEEVTEKLQAQEKLKEEMKPKNKKRRNRVSSELVTTKIIEFLIANGKSPLSHIQEYVEAELNTTWVNFTTVMNRVLEKTSKVEKVEYGQYKYVPREE